MRFDVGGDVRSPGASAFAAAATLRGALPLTVISTSGEVRAWPPEIGVDDVPAQLRRRAIPLVRGASRSAASERMISLTVRGFVARLWIWPPPCGVNGWPR